MFNQLLFPLHSAFLGIPLERNSKNTFQELQNCLKEFDDILRSQDPQTPHLTLQFWKELMEIEYYQAIQQSKKLADSSSAFMLKVQGASTFGSRGEDRVLYLKIPFSDELLRLKKRCPWPSLRPLSAGYGRQANIEVSLHTLLSLVSSIHRSLPSTKRGL